MSTPHTPYLRVAHDLRSKIEHGELRPGDQVPSVTKIADSYSVSRSTARRALDKLKEWGLTEAEPGYGTFVKP
jgi:DNA-binding GntR family transcriptional regulator